MQSLVGIVFIENTVGNYVNRVMALLGNDICQYIARRPDEFAASFLDDRMQLLTLVQARWLQCGISLTLEGLPSVSFFLEEENRI